MEQTVEQMAMDAIREAQIMEYGQSEFSNDHMLHVAEKLSGVPYCWIKEVYTKRFSYKY